MCEIDAPPDQPRNLYSYGVAADQDLLCQHAAANHYRVHSGSRASQAVMQGEITKAFAHIFEAHADVTSTPGCSFGACAP